jgi:hypothetical protein
MRDLVMLERGLLVRGLLVRGLLVRVLLVRVLRRLRGRLGRRQPTLGTFVTVEELGEVLGLVGINPDYDPGLAPGLFK